MAPAKTNAIPRCCLLHFRSDEFVSLAMNIDDLNLTVILEVLAQLGDIHIHGASVEVVVVDPDGLQGEVALQDLVGMTAEQGQQLVLLGGKLGLLIVDGEQLLLGIEGEATDAVHGALLVLLAI